MFWLVFSLSACDNDKPVYFFTSFHEPATEGLRLLYSYDGYHWNDLNRVLLKPAVGNQKVMRDPSIVQGPDGLFHLVWTCSWKGDRGFGYACSKDLVHWSAQKHINVMAYDTSTVNVWTPELFYDDTTDSFLIIWASTVPYKFDKGIEEERNNHRLYYTKTKDFQTFTPARLFFDPGYSVIDGTIVNRGAKDYVLVYKDNTRLERNLKVTFANKVPGPYEGESPAFTGFQTEGPAVVKVGAKWLIYYDAYGEKKYSAVSTLDFDSFEDISTEISVPKGHKHGTIFISNRKVLRKLLRAFHVKEVKPVK
ncbi:MAG: glycoside hydrolase family 43 protein [Bacteroidota bacterium]|nr:glycoside hydrolase family 43 protein [Bacteroidota bacterium]